MSGSELALQCPNLRYITVKTYKANVKHEQKPKQTNLWSTIGECKHIQYIDIIHIKQLFVRDIVAIWNAIKNKILHHSYLQRHPEASLLQLERIDNPKDIYINIGLRVSANLFCVILPIWQKCISKQLFSLKELNQKLI